MRILTTTMCYPTAGHPDQGLFVQRRALALAQLPGVELRVISPQPWCPLLRDDPGVAEPGPLPARYPRMFSVPVLGWATDGISFARALESEIVAEEVAGRRPDVIDAHFEYPDGVGAWLAGRNSGIPVVVTVRGKIVSLSRKALRRMQIAWMLRGVSARMAVSRSLVDWVHRVGGSDLSVHVIPNGVDPAVFHPNNRTHARQSLHWSLEHRIVLAVGHHQYVKGFDRLLEVAPRVASHAPDVRFVLVGSQRGEDAFRRRLQQLITACNAGRPVEDPLVRVSDPVPPHTLNQVYNAADLLVNTSRSEGWCNAIAEALACGTPVVALDVGGNREQITSDALGRLIPESDPQALVDSIVEALARNWDHDQIADIGSSRTWAQAAQASHSVLSDAILGQGAANRTAGVLT